MKRLLIGVFVCAAILGCKKNTKINEEKLRLNFGNPPINIPSGTKFAPNISYNSNPNSVFDVFLPASSKPTPLVVFIHGGGFTGGDKSIAYSQQSNDIQSYLQNSIAFATINYQFRTVGSDSGIMVSLNDIKRCIQFMRYNASDLNIDKAKIACYGGSAGGGASIYLAFHPDMADPSNADPVFRESTRLKAAGHLTSQCTYDPITMLNIFDSVGIDVLSIPGLKESLVADFGLSSFSQFYTDSKVIALRKELDMLGWMTSDDPEFFVGNPNPNNPPIQRSEVLHHPLHAKVLDNKATSIGLAHVTNIPSMNIFAANNETIGTFMIRKLNE